MSATAAGDTIACQHCGTAFHPDGGDDRFCCAGCAFVHHLIEEEGLDRFYDLKRGKATAPVKSRVFVQRNFDWLVRMAATAEAEAREKGSDLASLETAVQGISCLGCVWLIEQVFRRKPGAARVEIRASEAKVRLTWVAGQCDLREFAEELQRFGYVLAEPGTAARQRGRASDLGGRIGLAGAFAMNAMAFTLPRYLGMPDDFMFAGIFELITMASATLALLTGGSYFIRRAWMGLRAGALHIDVPIALGLIVAYAGSLGGWLAGQSSLVYFDFVAVFTFLMLLGRHLQVAAAERNRARVAGNAAIPESVAVVPDESTDPEEVPIDHLQNGMTVEIQPGGVFPVASRLVSDSATLSLEWINGESEPASRTEGALLPAGAINIGRTPVRAAALQAWKESLVARLADTRDGAEERRRPVFERILRWYIAVVLVVGIVGGAAWFAATGEPARSLGVMIAVLVVSCPCALGVAVPLADDLAVSSLQHVGVFVRRTGCLPTLRRIRKILFDKTGTLTLEAPTLANSEALTTLDPDARAALAALVQESLHPVGRSLREALGRIHAAAGTGFAPVADVPGMGARTTAPDGTAWSLGRPGWIGEGTSARPAAAEPADSRPALPTDGWDCQLARNGEPVARFRFVDRVRPQTIPMLEDLRTRGIATYVISGDRHAKVEDLARQLELPPDQVRGEMSPDDKAGFVRSVDSGGDTLVVGDGANDSLAFDAAACTATPVVDKGLLESKADFYFLSQGLGFFRDLFHVADARFRAVRGAFTFALLYNIIAVTVALSGHMNPLLASILMPLSSIATIGIVAFQFRRSGKN